MSSFASENTTSTSTGTSATSSLSSSTTSPLSTSSTLRDFLVRPTETCSRPKVASTSGSDTGRGTSSTLRSGSGHSSSGTATSSRSGLSSGQSSESQCSSSSRRNTTCDASTDSGCSSVNTTGTSSTSTATGTGTTTTGSTQGRPERFEFMWRNDMSMQEFLDLCSKTAQWCSQAANECASQWTSDANQNIDILRRDLSHMYDNIESVLTPRDLSCLTAAELRQRTIDDVYRQVKNDVVLCRESCRCLCSVRCSSAKILEEVKRMLESEGFDARYEVQPSCTIITVEW